MKALVCVKRVIDYNVKLRSSPTARVDLANVKMSMNPLRRDCRRGSDPPEGKGVVTEIVAVSVGPAKARNAAHRAGHGCGPRRAGPGWRQ